jgi:p-aminobenzoyl-glutamate transporter AbgT
MLTELTNNSNQNLLMAQKSKRFETLKRASYALVCLATLVLILDIINIKMVFGKGEVGLWDSLPGFVREIVLLVYPIFLVTSYVLFIVTKTVKFKLDFIPNILFLLNGLAIVLLLIIYFTELFKHL